MRILHWEGCIYWARFPVAAVRETSRAPPPGTGERRQLSLRLYSTFGHIWVISKIRKNNLQCKLELSIFCHCVSMRFAPSRASTQSWQGIMGAFHIDLWLVNSNLVEAGSCPVWIYGSGRLVFTSIFLTKMVNSHEGTCPAIGCRNLSPLLWRALKFIFYRNWNKYTMCACGHSLILLF